MSKNDPRKALGKGLHSLLPNRPAHNPLPTQPAEPEKATFHSSDRNVSRIRINPGGNSTRALLELTQSIERDGIIQPIIVRSTGPQQYQIIAGERRWRAAKAAGLKEVPVIPRKPTTRRFWNSPSSKTFSAKTLTRSNSHSLSIAWPRNWNSAMTRSARNRQRPRHRHEYNSAAAVAGGSAEFVVNGELNPGHARALLKLPTKLLSAK